jgi:hypothetical protein
LIERRILLKGFSLIAMLLMMAPCIFAQGSEKLPDTSEFSIPSSRRAAVVSGSLNGAPTYDRIFGSDVDPNCNAISSFSASGVGVPYAVFEVHTNNPAGENMSCSVNVGGTDVEDTVMSLYCSPFDPDNADQNLVAYDDDGGDGLLSAITPADGAYMEPNRSYYVVLAPFDNLTIGGGNYQLDMGGDIALGPSITVPTLGEYGMAAMVILLAGAGVFFLRRRQA